MPSPQPARPEQEAGPERRVVMKFGGTSVRDADALDRLCHIVRSDTRRRLVVVSALSGVTDQLVDLANRATAGESEALSKTIEALRTRHVDLATARAANTETE